MRRILQLLITLALFACSQKDERVSKTDMDELGQFAKAMSADISDYEAVIFIPLEGCGPCIRRSVEFYRNYKENPEFLFVFCTYKPFNYDFLKNNDNPNVIIDRRCVAIQEGILSAAPVAFKKENGAFRSLGPMTKERDLHCLL